MQQTKQITKVIVKIYKTVEIISLELNNNDGVADVNMVGSSDEQVVGSSDEQVVGASDEEIEADTDAVPLGNMDGILLGKLEDTPVTITFCASEG